MSQDQVENIHWHQGDDAQSLAENLAGEIALQINHAIADHGLAVVALSGGTTPKPLFQTLAQHDVDWAKVVITLVDERWVPSSHHLSNTAFIQENLLGLLPEEVSFVSLYQSAQTVEASCSTVLAAYCAATGSSLESPRKFDVVVLGMGSDGHTASFFPDAKNVAELVSSDAQSPLLTCMSPSTQVERITWSLPMLLNTAFLALHFTGFKKLGVFDEAAAGGNITELPIRAVIFQKQTPLNVYYSD